MSYPTPYNRSIPVGRVSTVAPRAALAGAGIGMMVGSTTALAKNIRRVKSGEINRREAVADTLTEGLGTGLATGAATAVVGAVGLTGWAGLLGLLTVATGVQYLWQEAAQASPAKQLSEKKKAKK